MEGSVFIGVGATIGLAVVGALMGVGRLQQRVAVLEHRDGEHERRVVSLQDRAAQQDVAKAIFEQKFSAMAVDVNVIRADLTKTSSTVAELKLQHTETRSDMKSVIEAMNQLRETVMRWEQDTRKMFSAALSGRFDRLSFDDDSGHPRSPREP